MMQAQNVATTKVNHVARTQASTQASTKLASEQKADKAKQAEVVDLPKPQSFSRTLEAYSDCV